MATSRRVLLCAGEASGDAYAAALVRALRAHRADLAFGGIGGPKLRAEGVPLVADSSSWGAISITQSLKVGPRILRNGLKLAADFRRGEPGLFIPIDFGFANLRLAKRAKEAGWKVLYFVPPGSWRRDRQGRDLGPLTDAVVTPFPWSVPLLEANGTNARFFGHPLKSMLRSLPAVERGNGVAVLPGSRRAEVDLLLPVFAKALAGLDRPVEFAVSPNLDAAALRHQWERQTGRAEDSFTVGDAHGVLRRSAAAVVCSGTATLEAALLGTPHVIVYRVTKTTAFEAKLIGFKMPPYVGLPNLILQRGVVPELLQDAATSEAIRSSLDQALGPDGDAQRAAFREIGDLLGPDDCLDQTAAWALELLGT